MNEIKRAAKLKMFCNIRKTHMESTLQRQRTTKKQKKRNSNHENDG